jgi:hypothetical protein
MVLKPIRYVIMARLDAATVHVQIGFVMLLSY